jgi:hypothetical protein
MINVYFLRDIKEKKITDDKLPMHRTRKKMTQQCFQQHDEMASWAIGTACAAHWTQTRPTSQQLFGLKK